MHNEAAEKIMRMCRDVRAEANSRRDKCGEEYWLAVGRSIGLRQAAEAVCRHPKWTKSDGDYCETCEARLA